MQTGSSGENSVGLSVRLSVKRVHCDKKEVRSFQIFYLTKDHLPSFLRRRIRWSETADFEPIFARSASAVTRCEKRSINTNRKSTTRFLMSLRWSAYVARKPVIRANKRKTAIFRLKSHFAWRKYYKVSLCENRQRQSCQAFIGLTICAKMIGGATPSTWNFGSKWPR